MIFRCPVPVFIVVLLFLVAPPRLARAQDDQSAFHVTRAATAEAEGDFDTALEEYSAAARSDTASSYLMGKVVHCLFRLGRDDEVMSFANALWKRDSTHSEVAEDAGEMAFMHGRMDEAAHWFQAAARARPEAAAPWLRLSAIYMQLDRKPESEKAAEEAVRREPDSGEALYTLGWVRARSGREAEALEPLQRLEKGASPPPARGLLLLAQVQENLKHFDEAREAYSKAAGRARSQGDMDEAQRGLARVAFMTRRPGDAISPLGQLLNSGKGDVRVRGLRLDAELRSGRLAEALADLDTLEQADPDNPQLVGLRASVLSQQQKPEAARQVLERFASAHPTLWRAHQLLAAQAFSSSRYKEASAHSARAESLAPDSSQVLFLKGQILSAMERQAEAQAAFLRVVQMDSTSDGAWFALGVVREKQNDLEGSEQAFRRVVALNPRAASARNYLGYMWVDRGMKLEEGLKEILQALELEPANPAFLDSKGWALFRLGRPAEARQALELAVKSGGQDAVIHEHLGDVLASLRLFTLARSAYREALARDPKSGSIPGKIHEVEKSIP